MTIKLTPHTAALFCFFSDNIMQHRSKNQIKLKEFLNSEKQKNHISSQRIEKY